MSVWNEWIMDVTQWPDYCFCPYEPDGSIVFGMNLIQERSPAKLVGIFHEGGQEFAEKWCKENPNWRELYAAKS